MRRRRGANLSAEDAEDESGDAGSKSGKIRVELDD